ncbi:MAG: hypothetical protein AAFX93_10425 [Verrucomicrobiota bacterium]
MTKLRSLFTLFVLSASLCSAAFDQSKDILIAQFDSNADPDDIHSIAALGCMLAHQDYAGVNYFAVAGAYGIQRDSGYIESPLFFRLVFGEQNVNWTDAFDNGNQTTNWDASVIRIKDKVKPILQAGGKVWVMEAGQSDITADWVRALIAEGVSESLIKTNVTVVQHSNWNEDHTTPADLAYVRDKTNYATINDGNGTNTSRDPSSPATPSYRTTNTTFQPEAYNSPNNKARAFWLEANWVILDKGHLPSHSSITTGGVDFSDVVEAHWIFGSPTDINTTRKFWDKLVVNTPSPNPEPQFPTGRNYGGDVTGSSSDPWIESGGLVVIDPEHGELHEDWRTRPSTYLDDPTMAGSLGSGWIEWTGPQKFNTTLDDSAANGISTLRFEIKTAGEYTFRWRTKQYNAGQAGDQGNDTYVKFETGTPIEATGSKGTKYTLTKFTKVWIQNKQAWSWGVNFEPHHGEFVNTAKVFYNAGVHEIKLAGRSRGHAIDRIVLHHSTVPFNAANFQNAPESERSGSGIIYDATEDFSSINTGEVPYYVDNGNDALAINAGNTNYRDKFARAQLTFDGQSGRYDITITTMTEEDGESTYRLLINGSVISTYQNPRVGSSADLQPNNHTWGNIQINNGDTLAIESNSASNDIIPEDGGFAWARGRWQQIELVPNTTGSGLSVNAGDDATIFYPPASIVLNGSASDDTGISTLLWTQESGPSTASLTGEATTTLNASNLVEGTYVFRLTATDTDSNQEFDEVSVIVQSEPPAINRVYIWQEDFEGATLGAISGNNETLVGTVIQTANTLASEVVAAPAGFTSASGNVIRLSTGANSFSALRSPSEIDLSQYHFRDGDRYILAFDLYIPADLSSPVGAVNFRWKNGGNTTNGPTEVTYEQQSAGVWRIEYSGTFPVDTGNGDFHPTNVRPFIWFDQDGSAVSDFAYLDNIAFRIEPPRITRTSLWSEDFESLTLGAQSGNNQTLPGSSIQTANTLESEVVNAPAEFTSASGKVIRLTTGANSFSAIRPSISEIDLSGYNLQDGDQFTLSFDVYIPADLAAPVGSVNFRWKNGSNTGNGPTDTTNGVISAGVHRVVYTGTFPVDSGSGDFIPTNVRPFIWFDLNGAAASNYVYFDNLNLEIAPPSGGLNGFEKFESDYSIAFGHDGDDDGDGLVNLLEYAFGGHPKQSRDAAHRPRLRIDRSNGTDVMEFEFRRLKDEESGIIYRVQISNDLRTWNNTNLTTTVEPDSPEFEMVKLEIPSDVMPTFVRLEVEMVIP